MTEQTKAIFENPQLLRQKLSEYFDTSNEKIIEKYALVAEKMFEKGNKEKLKMYFNEWSVGVWVAAISLFITMLGLTLSIFGISFSYIITYGAIAVFGLTIFGHVFILAYRGYICNFLDLARNFLYVFVLIVVIVGAAITFGRFVLDFGIIWVAIVFVLLPIFSLFGFRYLFVKELVIKNIAELLDNAVKNAERKKVRKFFFISVSEFKKGGGRNFFKTIFMTIFAIVLLGAIAGKGIKESEKKRLAEEREEQRKTMLNKEQNKIQDQAQVNPIENTKTLDKQRAGQILVELCEKNNAEACYELSKTYALTDKIKMLELEQKACELGWMQSCFELGLFYKDNNNEQKAYEYFKISCDSDLAWACRELSLMYEFGDFVTQDKVEANLLLNKAIKLYEPKCYKEKNFKICEFLGEQYSNKADWVNAIKFYSLACENGLPYTCGLVAQMYEKGENVKQDLAQAKEYYGKYCDLGFEEGCKEYKRLNN